jgi:hypothetical protein
MARGIPSLRTKKKSKSSSVGRRSVQLWGTVRHWVNDFDTRTKKEIKRESATDTRSEEDGYAKLVGQTKGSFSYAHLQRGHRVKQDALHNKHDMAAICMYSPWASGTYQEQGKKGTTPAREDALTDQKQVVDRSR